MRTNICFILICSILFMYMPNTYAVADTSERFDMLQNSLAELEVLFEQCRQLNITTDYEKVNYTVIKKFILFGKEDFENNETNRAEYVASYLEELFTQTKNKLNSYTNGMDYSPAFNRYVTADTKPQISGASVYGATKNNATGEINTRPLILTGYGHFSSVARDIEDLKDLGVSLIQTELGPNSIIVSPTNNFAGGWRNINNGGCDANAQITQNALHITNHSAYQQGKFFQIMQSILVKPNTQYLISFKAKSTANGVTVFPSGWGSEGINVAASATYRTYNANYTTTAQQSIMEFMLISTNIGEVFFDDITVTETTTGNRVILNGDFEKSLKIQNGFGIDELVVEHVRNILQRAQQANIGVNLLISPHYFPSFIIEENPAELSHTQQYLEHTTYNIYHPRAKEVLNAFIDAVIPLIKDYKSLHSICLSNEPTFNTLTDGDRFLSQWQAYLSQKYGNIMTLNKAFGTNYAGFSSVPMPVPLSKTAEFNEYILFNNTMFANWHDELAQRIKFFAKDIPLHSKMLEYIPYIGTSDTDYYRNFLMIGEDAKLFSAFSDYAGTDAHAYAYEGLSSKMMWYDYLSTVTGKPIFNSEDHFIADGETDYSPAQAAHVSADLWQGAIHGRNAQTAWVYERTFDSQSSFSGSLLHRPDVVASIGKTSLDLSSLSEEITALQNVSAKVAILYSSATRTYNENHTSALLQSYKAASYLGKRIAIVDEQQIKDSALNGIELFILPDVTNISEEVLDKIIQYQENGGKVVIIKPLVGGVPLKYDIHHKANNISKVSSILNNSTQLNAIYADRTISSPSVDSLYKTLSAKVSSDIGVTDITTGDKASDVEYRYVQMNGRHIVNLYNNSATAKKVVVTLNGMQPKVVTDLINRRGVAAIELSPKQPMLISMLFEKPQPVLSATVTQAIQGYNISWTPPQSGDYQGFQIYQKLSNDGLRLLSTMPKTVASYNANLPLGIYTFVVKTLYKNGELSDGKETTITVKTQITTLTKQSEKILISGETTANANVNMVLLKDNNVVAVNDTKSNQDGYFTFLFDILKDAPIPDQQKFTLLLKSDSDDHALTIQFTYKDLKADAGASKITINTPVYENGYMVLRGKTTANTLVNIVIMAKNQTNPNTVYALGDTKSDGKGDFAFTFRVDINSLALEERAMDIFVKTKNESEPYQSSFVYTVPDSGSVSKGEFSGGGVGGSSVKKEYFGMGSVGTTSTVTNTQNLMFTDISDVPWAVDGIQALAKKNIINGYGDGTFQPNKTVTREEFLKMLLLSIGTFDPNATCEFDDAIKGKWYYPYIATAYQSGLVRGVSPRQFGVGTEISREDMCVMAYHVLDSIPQNREYNEFSDENEISDYALNAIKLLYSSGLVNGISDKFAPKAKTTRAEAVTLIARLIKTRGGE